MITQQKRNRRPHKWTMAQSFVACHNQLWKAPWRAIFGLRLWHNFLSHIKASGPPKSTANQLTCFSFFLVVSDGIRVTLEALKDSPRNTIVSSQDRYNRKLWVEWSKQDRETKNKIKKKEWREIAVMWKGKQVSLKFNDVGCCCQESYLTVKWTVKMAVSLGG